MSQVTEEEIPEQRVNVSTFPLLEKHDTTHKHTQGGGRGQPGKTCFLHFRSSLTATT